MSVLSLPSAPASGPAPTGLGFRGAFGAELVARAPELSGLVQFVELAPENYLGAAGPVGGSRGRLLLGARAAFPIVSHGLCGDFAGSAGIDDELVAQLTVFLGQQGARWYSDHLCLTHAAGNALHDLLPLPFRDDAAARAAARIRALQARLGLPLAVENVSAYLRAPGGEVDEATFLNWVLADADCLLLLDVNNVYVNSVNFGFDPRAFIDALPLHRVVQLHVAGHDTEIPGELLIDTHAAPVADPVYGLLRHTLTRLAAERRAPPVLLERDHAFPPLDDLLDELRQIQAIAREAWNAGTPAAEVAHG